MQEIFFERIRGWPFLPAPQPTAAGLLLLPALRGQLQAPVPKLPRGHLRLHTRGFWHTAVDDCASDKLPAHEPGAHQCAHINVSSLLGLDDNAWSGRLFSRPAAAHTQLKGKGYTGTSWHTRPSPGLESSLRLMTQ